MDIALFVFLLPVGLIGFALGVRVGAERERLREAVRRIRSQY